MQKRYTVCAAAHISKLYPPVCGRHKIDNVTQRVRGINDAHSAPYCEWNSVAFARSLERHTHK